MRKVWSKILITSPRISPLVTAKAWYFGPNIVSSCARAASRVDAGFRDR